MAIPESPIISLCSSPRISFSHDLADHNNTSTGQNSNSTAPAAIRSDLNLIQNFDTSDDDDCSSLNIVDFNFCVPASGFDHQFICPADQLFSGGMIIPTTTTDNNHQKQQQRQSLEKKKKKKDVKMNSSIPKPNSNSINPSSRGGENCWRDYNNGDKTRDHIENSSASKSTAAIREEKGNNSSGGGAAGSSSKSSTSFWGFKRSSSCNCDGGNYQTKKSSIWSALPLLARSNSTGSSPKQTNNKATSSSSTTSSSSSSSSSNRHLMKSLSLTSIVTSGNQNGNGNGNGNGKPPARKSSSGSYQQGGAALMSMNGNGGVLNVPPPYIIKGTSDLLGLGSLFRNGNAANRDKKTSSNKKR